MTDTRDAFESFAISGFSPALDCSMKGNDYAYTTTHENWLTWQAATLAAQDPRKPLTHKQRLDLHRHDRSPAQDKS